MKGRIGLIIMAVVTAVLVAVIVANFEKRKHQRYWEYRKAQLRGHLEIKRVSKWLGPPGWERGR